METNERQAWLLLAERVESDTAHLIRVAVEAMEDRQAFPVLRGPGETTAGYRPFVCPDCRSGCDPCDCGSDTPWVRALRPGERMIDGQVFYSAEWLND